MVLPLELFGTLADILKDDKAALRSLSLTHRSLTAVAQRRLFYHISVGGEIGDVDPDNSIFHALKVTPHSHILSYIHSVTLYNLLDSSRRIIRSSTHYIPNPLAPKLIDTLAPQLTSLHLIGFAPGWKHGAALPLRKSIVRLLSSPSLKHLGLDGVNTFTLGLLNRCSSLKSLLYATPLPSYTLLPRDDDASSPIELEKLDLKLLGELSAVAFIAWLLGASPLECNLSLAKLQELAVNGSFTKTVFTKLRSLLVCCDTSLRHLSLGPEAFEFVDAPTPPLPSLTTLTFTWGTTYHPTPFDCTTTTRISPFPFLVHLLSPFCSFPHAANITPGNSLTTIDIHCLLTLRPNFYRDPVTDEHNVHHTPLPPGAYQIKADFFDPLVQVLKEGVRSGRLAKLRNVRVGVGVNVYTDEYMGPNPNQWVYCNDFLEVYRMRFGDFGEVEEDRGVRLEFYELEL